MLRVTLRKMWKNKWLCACLLLGCLLSVTFMSSLTTYSTAIVQRLSSRTFYKLHQENLLHPLVYTLNTYVNPAEIDPGGREYYDNLANSGYFEQLQGASASFTRQTLSISTYIDYYTPDREPTGSAQGIRAELMSISGLEDHINIIQGRLMKSGRDENGEYEIMLSVKSAQLLGLPVGAHYAVRDVYNKDGSPLMVKVAGVFEQGNIYDPFWFENLSTTTIFISHDSFWELLESGGDKSASAVANWKYAIDYENLSINDIMGILETIAAQTGTKRKTLNMHLSNILKLEYILAMKVNLENFFFVLFPPVLLLLAFFIVMITNLLIEHDRNEMSLLRSRGVSKGKIFLIYIYQSGIITIASLALGIPLSLWICKQLGAVGGFLELMGRTGFTVEWRAESLPYPMAGVLLFLGCTLLPVVFSKESSIVSSKRGRLKRKAPIYHRMFLDFICLALSLYGIYSYDTFSRVLFSSSEDTSVVSPAMYLLSSLFIIGCAMLFTRIYPYLIKLMFRIGRDRWPAVIYASLIRASRAAVNTRLLIIFLITTIALGIFSSVSARTVNQNNIDQISYEIGADVRLFEKWTYIDPDPVYVSRVSVEPKKKDDWELIYYEQSFPYADIEGIETATMVYRNKNKAQVGFTPGGVSAYPGISIMAIEPALFSSVAYARDDMYSYHINYMMNAMIKNPNHILVSRDLMTLLKLENGSILYVKPHGGAEVLECVVYDAFDYFPGYYSTSEGKTKQSNRILEHLVVVNYSLFDRSSVTQPYEVWLKLEDGASPVDVMHKIQDTGKTLKTYQASASRIAEMRVDPYIQGMNGNLTLNFIITMIITMTGFLIFWIFDLKSRQLQLGIIRSMGMTNRGVILMLLWEQLLMSVIPVLVGFGIGRLCAGLYTPMVNFGATAESVSPKFRLYILSGDFLLVGLIVLGSVIAAIVVLSVLSVRMKISQTLKLGED